MHYRSIALVSFTALAAIPIACGSSSEDLFSTEAAGTGAAAATSSATSNASTGSMDASATTTTTSGSGAAASTTGATGGASVATVGTGTGGTAQTVGSGGSAQTVGAGGNAQTVGAGGNAQTVGAGGNAQTVGAGGNAQTVGAGGNAQTVGAGGGTVEDCLNDVDDNGDGLVDCADPTCAAGFVCEHQPSQWNGPVILYEGPPGTSPSCPNDYPDTDVIGFTNITGDPATCSACSCVPPQAGCAPGMLSSFADVTCAVSTNTQSQSSTCHGVNGGAAVAFSAKPPTVIQSSGGCSPQGGAANVPPIDYATEAVICGGTPAFGGGCGNDACVPRPPAPFGASLCVYRDGTFPACPPKYPTMHSYATSYLDTRDCSDCTCGTPAAASCTATTSFFSDNQCMTADGSMPDDNSCNVPAGTVNGFKVNTKLTNPGCPADGGKPVGSVTPTQLVTVCCQ